MNHIKVNWLYHINVKVYSNPIFSQSDGGTRFLLALTSSIRDTDVAHKVHHFESSISRKAAEDPP